MDTLAIVFEEPERLALRRLELTPPEPSDVIVDILWSGISTGTERLLWLGRMPPFPGMGYPLVPGYESVGRITSAGAQSGRREGEFVFVPGARCFGDVRGLFGGAAARIVVAAERVLPVDERLGEQAVLLALAATAYHTMVDHQRPDLIVGHGVLGRLMARLALLKGGEPPVVWETNPVRAAAGSLYPVIHPEADARHDYGAVYDASGDAGLLDTLIKRLRRGGEVVLAGFYSAPLSFNFPPAFLREARIRVAAEWVPSDLAAVRHLIETGKLSLDSLITHCAEAGDAAGAYRTSFGDPACLKMILDWRRCS
jgi:3-hydroxyethyl bacteriochlorophyllide a dehydrogenase